jgi:hypothetical protein
MANAALFIGWGAAVRGREEVGLKVFDEAIQFLVGLREAGEIESFEPVFLEPHGGDLSGFILVRGDREALARVRTSDEMNRLNLRADQVVESYGVVGGLLGDSIPGQVELYQSEVADLTSG